MRKVNSQVLSTRSPMRNIWRTT